MPFLIISFLILTVISILYYKYAIKTNIIDNPNHRSSHTKPTIRGGGIVFFIAVLLFVIFQKEISYPYFFIGFLGLSIIGFIDDKKELSAKLRFPFQLLAVALILYDAGLFTNDLPLVMQILGFIVGVGFVNAFNFMDGINGITGFYTLAVVVPLLYLNFQYKIFDNQFFIVIILAIIVFAYYNFRKQALMFAGDIGSMALASVLLFWLAKFMVELKSPILILLMVIYGLDSAMTIIYRIFLKENISEAHRHHIYQKMVDIRKMSHLQVAFVYALLQVLISVTVIQFLPLSLPQQWIGIVVAFVLGILLYVGLQYYFVKKYIRRQN